MAVVTTNLGTVTAYGDAVAAGYTGTKEQWQALMADYATVGTQAAQDAQTASTAATTATTAAQTATTKAGEASASAEAAAESAASIGTPDTTLTQSGKAADAKVTGDKISEIKEDLSDMNTATASDVGKYLRATAVENGKVTSWQFSTPSGGGGGGQDGFSPIVTVTNITGGHRVSITDATGTKTFDVMDGTNGTNGTTFTPSVSSAGVISWTNDGGKQNPSAVDLVVAIPTATTQAAGKMSATDKGRLDTLYADYSSALTALGVI